MSLSGLHKTAFGEGIQGRAIAVISTFWLDDED